MSSDVPFGYSCTFGTAQARSNPGLTDWISQRGGGELFLSVISIGEIERGIYSVAKKDIEFADRLTAWRDKLLMIYADRLLPVSVAVARHWGRLSIEAGNAGADILIAAPALGAWSDSGNTQYASLFGGGCANMQSLDLTLFVGVIPGPKSPKRR